ncbi:MAG: hypothetical protein K0S71_348 [Clostridia bacterium]|jgi:hypothetical protein|nr:hypothetical protein [Clostridia bacterium]
MGKSIEVKLTPELVSRIAQEAPKKALKELVWNSCDADASKINIKYDVNELDSIERIWVEDNGHGIDYDNVENLFGNLGKSQKSYAQTSPKGRIYHGKLGQGRYKGFSLGDKITWHSKYTSNGEILEFDILCGSNDLKKFDLTTAAKSSSAETGVIVRIENVDAKKANVLLKEEEIKQDLLATFAPYLLAYKELVINYNQNILNPDDHIEKKQEKIIEYDYMQKKYYCKALIIQWNSSFERKLYICGESGVVYDEMPLNCSKAIPISTYIMSAYFDELHKSNTLTLLNPGYGEIIEKVNELINEYMREEISRTATEQIKVLKNEQVYPYEGEPKDQIDKVERQIFDILAVEINRYSPKIKSANKESKKLTYRLIKEALKSSPDNVTKILTEVFSLSKEQQDELVELLSFTTLPAIINTSKVISDRLLFLNGLENMVYDKSISKPIKERTQFHKILLNELWVFGEKYTYGVDDVSLKNVLKEYIKALGREDLIPDIPKEAIEDLTRIPDICLWQQYPNREETVENLVIELKRPSCTLSKVELDQIEDYAYKIAGNKLFPKEKTKWRFILIAKDYDEFISFKLQESNQKNQGDYYESKDGNIVISVLRWSDLILANKMKYNFLREKLSYRMEDKMQGFEYIQKKYNQYFK